MLAMQHACRRGVAAACYLWVRARLVARLGTRPDQCRVAVLLGTNLWILLLGAAVVLLRLRFAGDAWAMIAKAATGLLMLAFASDGVRRLAGV
jgi:Mg2+/Co2+ transporter CorB